LAEAEKTLQKNKDLEEGTADREKLVDLATLDVEYVGYEKDQKEAEVAHNSRLKGAIKSLLNTMEKLEDGTRAKYAAAAGEEKKEAEFTFDLAKARMDESKAEVDILIAESKKEAKDGDQDQQE